MTAPAVVELDDVTPARLWAHGLLLVRGVEVGNAALEAVARRFGEPIVVARVAFRAGGARHVRLQSNVAGLGAVSTGGYWHADGPLSDPPVAVTLLLCDEAPDAGGGTLFVDAAAAHDRLSPALRRRIAGLDGRFPCHDAPKLVHPLASPHPCTGRRALHLDERWLRGIAGVDPAESRALLQELYAVATDPRYVHVHVWRPGDLLVWDDAATLHKAQPCLAGRKLMRRVTVVGRQVRAPNL